MIEDRWVHAARRLTSIEFSFGPCNIYRDGPRGVGYPADARSVGDSHPLYKLTRSRQHLHDRNTVHYTGYNCISKKNILLNFPYYMYSRSPILSIIVRLYFHGPKSTSARKFFQTFITRSRKKEERIVLWRFLNNLCLGYIICMSSCKRNWTRIKRRHLFASTKPNTSL